MNNIKDVYKALTRTNDGRSVFFWTLVFFVFLLRSIANKGLESDQWRYLFYPLIAVLIFYRFRVNDSQSEPKTNMWGFFNVNGFCLFLIYVEFFND